MDPNQFPPNSEEQGNRDDYLFEDLVAAISLFNPDQLWQREVELEAPDEQAAAPPESTDSAESAAM